MKRGFLVFLSLSMNVAALTRADVLMTENFSYPDGIITNEFAFWNPSLPQSVISPVWQLDSGSLFAKSAEGWTGIPDDKAPNALSTNGNNSCIFRLATKRKDFEDVTVSFSLLNQGLSSSPSTPAVDWDGLHIWLRYQSETHLYYASVNRRDNTVVIKKKIPGGPSNGGTYFNLSSYVPFTVPYNTWQQVKASVQNNSDGSVTLKLYRGNSLLVSATDNGTIGGAPIRAAGRVGLRGDNANLKFDNFVVSDFNTTPPPPSPPAAPGNIAAVPGAAKLTITWGSVAGATSYNMYHRSSSGVTTANGTKVPGVASPFELSNLTNGIRRFVVVTAVGPGGESAVSAEVSGIPTAPPPPPAPPEEPPVPPVTPPSDPPIVPEIPTVPEAPSAQDLLLKPRVYPIAWNGKKHLGTPILFENLPAHSMVRIIGRMGYISTLNAETGATAWNLTNDSGEKVASGVYKYFVSGEKGEKLSGTLVVIK